MFKSLVVRASQGTQFIRDPRRADPAGFRGKPVIADTACETGCTSCVAAWAFSAARACASSVMLCSLARDAGVSATSGRCSICVITCTQLSTLTRPTIAMCIQVQRLWL